MLIRTFKTSEAGETSWVWNFPERWWWASGDYSTSTNHAKKWHQQNSTMLIWVSSKQMLLFFQHWQNASSSSGGGGSSISFRFFHTLGVFKLVCTEILGRTDLSCRKEFNTLGCPGFVICMHIFRYILCYRKHTSEIKTQMLQQQQQLDQHLCCSSTSLQIQWSTAVSSASTGILPHQTPLIQQLCQSSTTTMIFRARCKILTIDLLGTSSHFCGSSGVEKGPKKTIALHLKNWRWEEETLKPFLWRESGFLTKGKG